MVVLSVYSWAFVLLLIACEFLVDQCILFCRRVAMLQSPNASINRVGASCEVLVTSICGIRVTAAFYL